MPDLPIHMRYSQGSELKRILLLILLLGLIAATIYLDSLSAIFCEILGREDSSHGLFVPFISLYFLWHKRSHLRKEEKDWDFVAGLPVAAGGLLVLVLSRTSDRSHWEGLSFAIVLSGLVICLFGKGVFKELWFAIAFLLCMIPVPDQLYACLTELIREATIGASTSVLAIMGVPIVREGVMIQLPNTLLHIDIGCSGIRYLLAYFVFGLAYAYLYRGKLSDRIFIVALTIPISLLASTLRLTTIAFLAYCVGPHMAEHRPHVLTSWLVFASVLVFFVGVDRWLMGRHVRGS
jgi:exosortase